MPHRYKSFWRRFTLGLGLWTAGIGCGDDSRTLPPPPKVDSDAYVGPSGDDKCRDEDGDGFLAGCLGGTDCDDSNPDVGDECNRCRTPEEGCPCDTEGQTTECGNVASRVGDFVTCIKGTRTCTDGAWGECRPEGLQTLTVGPGRGSRALAVGTGPTACDNNPCDPHCSHFDDSVPPTLDGSVQTDAGITLPSIGGGFSSGPSACGTQSSQAQRHPLGAVLMVDKSGSMDQVNSCTNASTSDDNTCPWKNVQTALKSFVQSPTAAGMYMGLDFFPARTSSPTCGIGDEYVGINYVTAVGTGTSKFTVDVGLVPTVTTPIVNAINAVTNPNGGTPMVEAVGGALKEAKAWQMAQGDPQARGIVILVTDGLPTDCGNCSTGKKGKLKSGTKREASCKVQEVAQLIETYYFGTPSIETFIIGVDSDGANNGDNLTYLDVLARAGSGGTRDAYLVDGQSASNGSSAILTALNDIRNETLSCEFEVPTPPMGVIDPASTEITFTSGGTATVLTKRDTLGACTVNGTPAEGYTFDLGGPTIELCPQTCAAAKSDLTATIDIEYTCRDACTSGTSRGEPGPLDMLVMMDRSGSMRTETSGVTRWQAATMALRNFLRNPESEGMGFGISFFPVPAGCQTCGYCDGFLGGCGSGDSDWNKAAWLGPNVNSAPCDEPRQVNTNCTNADGYDGTSRLSGRYYRGSTSTCTSSDYVNFTSTGGAAVQILPGTDNAVVEAMYTALLRQIPDGATPTRAALKGAIDYMIAAPYGPRPDVKKVVVLVTDGAPTDCGNNSDIVAEATAGYNAGIETFVIGVSDGGSGAPSTANMNAIARAGSGNRYDAFMVNTSNPNAFMDALNQIRRRAMNCSFAVPTPPLDGELDLESPEIVIYSGSTTPPDTHLTPVYGANECFSNESWYYDDPDNPSTINLCSEACAIAQGDLDSRVDILYQCVSEGYEVGTSLLEFDATGACDDDEQVIWDDFSWDASTPSDSKITFEVATGTRDENGAVTGLSAFVPLEFTRDASPDLRNVNACAGAAGVCVDGFDTQEIGVFAVAVNDVYVNETLQQNSLPTGNNYLAIRVTLTPSSDGLNAPLLQSWDLRVSCKDKE